MSQGGDSQQRLRKNNTGEPHALPLTGAAAKSPTGPRTNMHPADDDFDDFEEPPRSPSSTIRRDTFSRNLPSPTTPTTPVQRRQSNSRDLFPPSRQTNSRELPPRSTRNTTTQYGVTPPGAKAKRRNSSAHWLLPVGIGMVAMLVLWVFGTIAVSWGQQRYQDITYGRPRTYQTDAIVGHNDSLQHKSHFIAVNYNRQAIVTEWMGGDPAKSVVYIVPYYIVGDNSELTPVTVELRDVTADSKPDLVIHIHLSTQDQTFVFVNDGKKFRPPLATDKITM